MRFLHPEYAVWLVATFAVAFLLKSGVRWRFAAFTAVLPSRCFPYRASLFRRLPFLILAVAAALAGLALMQPVIPYSQADLSSKGLDIVLLLDLSSSMQEEMGSGQSRTMNRSPAKANTGSSKRSCASARPPAASSRSAPMK